MSICDCLNDIPTLIMARSPLLHERVFPPRQAGLSCMHSPALHHKELRNPYPASDRHLPGQALALSLPGPKFFVCSDYRFSPCPPAFQVLKSSTSFSQDYIHISCQFIRINPKIKNQAGKILLKTLNPEWQMTHGYALSKD